MVKSREDQMKSLNIFGDCFPLGNTDDWMTVMYFKTHQHNLNHPMAVEYKAEKFVTITVFSKKSFDILTYIGWD